MRSSANASPISSRGYASGQCEGRRRRALPRSGLRRRLHRPLWRGLNESFTVRKISYGEGVERVFPVFGPLIDSIRILRKGKVRRAKLYYLRDRRGKSARIAERIDVKIENIEPETPVKKEKRVKPAAQAAVRQAKGGGKK